MSDIANYLLAGLILCMAGAGQLFKLCARNAGTVIRTASFVAHLFGRK